MKITKTLFISAAVAFALFAFGACGDTDDVDDTTAAPETTAATEAATEATEPASAVGGYGNYGYAGDDPVEAEVYQYMIDEIADNYYGADDDNGIISIPVVKVVDRVDNADGSSDVAGVFQIYNYKVEGDTLKCVSGGSHPGKMHIVKDVDEDGDDDNDADDAYENDADDKNDYEVTKFDQVADGGQFDSSAREIFGDKYEDFSKANSDDKDLEKLRADGIAVYVKATGIAVTKYQDEGWDPVDIPL